MSITYRKGQTFEDVALAVYGDSSKAEEIREANGYGTGELPRDGAVLSVPTEIRRPLSLLAASGIEVQFSGSVFGNWSSFVCRKAVDGIDVVTIAAPLEKVVGAGIRPFAYEEMTVFIDGVLFFTGTVVSVNPAVSDKEKYAVVEAYSKPGVLYDCCAPISSFPMYFESSNLESIASKLARIYNVGVVFDTPSKDPFPRLELDPQRTIADFLLELAYQDNIIVRSDESGRLVFFRPSSKPAVKMRYVEGEQPFTGLETDFEPQEYFSELTAVLPLDTGGVGAKHTVKNPHLWGRLRAHNFMPSDLRAKAENTGWVNNFEAYDAELADNSDRVLRAARAKASRMFGNAIKYAIPKIPGWRGDDGTFIKPGDGILIKSPSVFVYDEYLMMVRSIDYRATPSQQICSIGLVLPQAYNGEIPEKMPWDTAQA